MPHCLKSHAAAHLINVSLPLNIGFAKVKSADPNEIMSSVALYFGVHCTQRYPFRGFCLQRVILNYLTLFC